MTITKTKNNTYQLKIYIPAVARDLLHIKGSHFEKRYKTRKEAKLAEFKLLQQLHAIEMGEFEEITKPEDILFSDFFYNIWWEAYKAGQTTATVKPPSQATIRNTEIVFRKHILPMFSNFTMDFLNQNKQVVLNLMTSKSRDYANFKSLKSYVNSMFDWAEELEYIEVNRLSKTLRRIKPIKKIQLQDAKYNKDLYLSQNELQAWFDAFKADLENKKISTKDYVLFFLTFSLSDRKSESYALQWKHIDFEKGSIQLVQALDRYKGVKTTKGNKKTIFNISKRLISLLQSWKNQQLHELAKFGIIQTQEQYVFTYIDTKGNVNSKLHADYLNNKMKSVRNRHPNLAHATPHKLRHTGATLAKQAGISLEEISKALTHSDTQTTQTYVNTSNIVPIAMGEYVYKNLKNN